jgi:hypothetical protein
MEVETSSDAHIYIRHITYVPSNSHEDPVSFVRASTEMLHSITMNLLIGER